MGMLSRTLLALVASLVLPLMTGWFSRPDMENLQPQWYEPAGHGSRPRQLVQSFVAHQPGLETIELVPAIYDSQGQPQRAQESWVVFRLKDRLDGPDLYTQVVAASEFVHNRQFDLRFSPRWDWKDKVLFLEIDLPQLDSTDAIKFTFWSTSLDVYPEGELFIDGNPSGGDLTFKTFYSYSIETVAADLGWVFSQMGVVLIALLFLWAPGYLLSLLLALDLSEADKFERGMTYICLTLCLAPILFLWTSTVGARLDRESLRVVLSFVIVVAASLALHRWQAHLSRSGGLRSWLGLQARAMTNQAFYPIAIIALAFMVRLVMIKDLLVPLWVDAVHHTAIAELMSEQGRIPISFEPFVSMPYNYHFGFHSVVVLFSWLTAMPIESSILLVGQLIGTLIPLSAYSLSRSLQVNRTVSFAVMGLIAFFTSMPTYYLNWGRYTILAGLVLLLASCAVFQRYIQHGDRRLVIAGVLLAGLMATHYRLVAFYAAFVLAAAGVQVLGHANGKLAIAWRLFSNLMVIGGLAGILTIPWLNKIFEFVLLLVKNRITVGGVSSGIQVAPVTPWLAGWSDALYLMVPRTYDHILLLLAIFGVIAALVLRDRGAIIILGWYGVLFLLAAFQFLSLTFEDNSVDLVAITAFYPLALFSALGVAELLRRIRAVPLVNNLYGHSTKLWAFSFFLACWLGAANLLGLVDPGKIIFTRYDAQAMEWIKGNTPLDSVFLINDYLWKGDVYYGVDGGYWIQLKTGRRTTLPPLIYGFASVDLKERINDLAVLTSTRQDWDEGTLVDLLRERNVNYIYVGHRGGELKAEMFNSSPFYQLVYFNGRVRIYKANSVNTGMGYP